MVCQLIGYYFPPIYPLKIIGNNFCRFCGNNLEKYVRSNPPTLQSFIPKNPPISLLRMILINNNS